MWHNRMWLKMLFDVTKYMCGCDKRLINGVIRFINRHDQIRLLASSNRTKVC